MKSANHVACAAALGWLLPPAVVSQRFRAMEALPTLAPRYYQPASPMLWPENLDKRQSSGQCEAGFHPCLDIGPLGSNSCCADDTYCIVDPTAGDKAACCAIGSVCGSPCSADQYQCNTTTTLAISPPPTPAVVTRSACCPRVCTHTSMFACPADLGGGCCAYGQACASSGRCLQTRIPTTVSSPGGVVVTELPPGCTTSQIACPSSLGGGCCAARSQSCTSVDGSAMCAVLSTTVRVSAAPSSGVSEVPRGKTGLSTGAKAGVAVAVVLGSTLVLSGLTWTYLARRRRRRRRRPGLGNDGTTVSGSEWSPRTEGAAMSLSSSAGFPSRPTLPRRAASGWPWRAFTRDEGGRGSRRRDDDGAVAADDGPLGQSAEVVHDVHVSSAGAVPREPHGPDDIVAPVEIDSHVGKGAHVTAAWSSVTGSSPAASPSHHEIVDGRYELYGSDFPSPESAPPDMPSPSGHAVSRENSRT